MDPWRNNKFVHPQWLVIVDPSLKLTLDGRIIWGMENKTPSHDDPQALISSFRKAERWLYTLIQDPTGKRYFQEKSMDVRMAEFKEQIRRMQAFMDYCGNPEESFPSIHIAGTSGKGSVVSLIAGILNAAEIKVGYHVSPYLQVSNEKLIVGEKMIAPSQFVSLVEEFKETYQRWLAENGEFSFLKYGEAWVALTYLWMAQQQVDWAVIETGLGGRYDPTNVLPSTLAVVTNVHYDHVEVLGEELTQIAAHKAGIIKPDSLAITAETNPEALAVIEEEALQKGSQLFRLGKEFDYSVQETQDGTRLTVNGVYQTYPDLRIAMTGEFQYLNAALAVAGVDLLAGQGKLRISEEQVRQGVQVQFPGRIEVVQDKPLVILDGAHNLHKATALTQSLQQSYPGKKWTVVLGTLSIKDFSGIIEVLAPITERWIATQPKVMGKPSTSPEALVEVIQRVTPDVEILKAEDVKEAIALALELAGEEDLVLVTGSLYMLGDARSVWYPVEDLLKELEQTI